MSTTARKPPVEGVRVLRGPNWQGGNTDGGEGHLGTVQWTGEDGAVRVLWDTGQEVTYSGGQHGKFQLRIFDTATVGVHHGYANCASCGEQGVYGILWQCQHCPDLFLCSQCYAADKHEMRHPFLRIDFPGNPGEPMRKRKVSVKTRAMGLFPGSKVRRGKHWKWEDQDGGEGNEGETQEIVSDPYKSSKRNLVKVRWPSGKMNVYRLAYDGFVDLICTDEAAGEYYYRDHLPCLNAKDFTSLMQIDVVSNSSNDLGGEQKDTTSENSIITAATTTTSESVTEPGSCSPIQTTVNTPCDQQSALNSQTHRIPTEKITEIPVDCMRDGTESATLYGLANSWPGACVKDQSLAAFSSGFHSGDPAFDEALCSPLHSKDLLVATSGKATINFLDTPKSAEEGCLSGRETESKEIVTLCRSGHEQDAEDIDDSKEVGDSVGTSCESSPPILRKNADKQPPKEEQSYILPTITGTPTEQAHQSPYISFSKLSNQPIKAEGFADKHASVIPEIDLECHDTTYRSKLSPESSKGTGTHTETDEVEQISLSGVIQQDSEAWLTVPDVTSEPTVDRNSETGVKQRILDTSCCTSLPDAITTDTSDNDTCPTVVFKPWSPALQQTSKFPPNKGISKTILKRSVSYEHALESVRRGELKRQPKPSRASVPKRPPISSYMQRAIIESNELKATDVMKNMETSTTMTARTSPKTTFQWNVDRSSTDSNSTGSSPVLNRLEYRANCQVTDSSARQSINPRNIDGNNENRTVSANTERLTGRRVTDPNTPDPPFRWSGIAYAHEKGEGASIAGPGQREVNSGKRTHDFAVGNRAAINVPRETLRELQSSCGGVSYNLFKKIGRQGVVTKVDQPPGTVGLKLDNVVFRVNPEALVKIHPYSVGDAVQISDNLFLLQVINERTGWSPSMDRTVGMVGQITMILDNGNLKISFGSCSFTYSPASCLPAPGQSVDNLDHGGRKDSDGMNRFAARRREKGLAGYSLSPREIATLIGQRDDSGMGEEVTGRYRVQLDGLSLLSQLEDHLLTSDISSCTGCLMLRAVLLDDVALLWEICDQRHLNVSHAQFTALVVASMKGSMKVVKALLHMGSDVNATAKIMGQTALIAALDGGKEDVALLLLDNGANVRQRNDNRRTALHAAVSNRQHEAAQLLLHLGADANVQDKNGDTPLHCAIAYANDIMVDMLLQQEGINLRLVNNSDVTPLHLACMTRKSEAVALLLAMDSSTVNRKKANNFAPLHLCVRKNFLAGVRLLLINGNADINLSSGTQGYTALHFACLIASVDIVQLLLDMGAKVNIQSKKGGAPLHMAIGGVRISSSTDDCATDLPNRKHIAELLITWGAFVDVEDEMGRNPMEYGQPELLCAIEMFIAQNPHLVARINQSKNNSTSSTDQAMMASQSRGSALCSVCEGRSDITVRPCGHGAACRACVKCGLLCSACGNKIMTAADPLGSTQEETDDAATSRPYEAFVTKSDNPNERRPAKANDLTTLSFEQSDVTKERSSEDSNAVFIPVRRRATATITQSEYGKTGETLLHSSSEIDFYTGIKPSTDESEQTHGSLETEHDGNHGKYQCELKPCQNSETLPSKSYSPQHYTTPSVYVASESILDQQDSETTPNPKLVSPLTADVNFQPLQTTEVAQSEANLSCAIENRTVQSHRSRSQQLSPSNQAYQDDSALQESLFGSDVHQHNPMDTLSTSDSRIAEPSQPLSGHEFEAGHRAERSCHHSQALASCSRSFVSTQCNSSGDLAHAGPTVDVVNDSLAHRSQFSSKEENNVTQSETSPMTSCGRVVDNDSTSHDTHAAYVEDSGGDDDAAFLQEPHSWSLEDEALDSGDGETSVSIQSSGNKHHSLRFALEKSVFRQSDEDENLSCLVLQNPVKGTSTHYSNRDQQQGETPSSPMMTTSYDHINNQSVQHEHLSKVSQGDTKYYLGSQGWNDIYRHVAGPVQGPHSLGSDVTSSVGKTPSTDMGLGGQSSMRIDNREKITAAQADEIVQEGQRAHHSRDALTTDDRVVIQVMEKKLMELQVEVADVTNDVFQCLGRTGTVLERTQHGTVLVKFGSRRYEFNPLALMRVPVLNVGNTVRISTDNELVSLVNRRLGFSSGIEQTFGKVGVVTHIDQDFNVTVNFGEGSYKYSPACCMPAPGATPDRVCAGTWDLNAGIMRESSNSDQQAFVHKMVKKKKQHKARHYANVPVWDTSTTIPILFSAIWNENLNTITSMCKKNPALVNIYCEKRDQTPLIYASSIGRLEVVRELLILKADVNSSVPDKTVFALSAALESGQEETAVVLLEGGADPNMKTAKAFRSPLHMVVSGNMIQAAQVLLLKGADVNATDRFGDTPLIEALLLGKHEKLVDILLSAKKLDLSVVNKRGMSALHVACSRNNHRAVERILQQDTRQVNTLDAAGLSPLHTAVVNNYEMTISLLLMTIGGADVNIPRRQDSARPLHLASQRGQRLAVETLLDCGAQVDVVDIHLNTPLHLAMKCARQSEALDDPADLHTRQERVGIACLLISNGAQVDAVNRQGKTCFSEANKTVRDAVQAFVADKKGALFEAIT